MAIVLDRGELMLRCGPLGESPRIQHIFSENDDETPIEKEVRFMQNVQRDEKQLEVIATVPLRCGLSYHSVLCQHYFEVAGASQVCMAQVPFLVSLTFGVTSAIVCDFAHTSSRITAVQDGWTLHSSSIESPRLSGVCQNKLLENIGISGASNLHYVKTQSSFVPSADSTGNFTSRRVLPDENVISVSEDMSRNLGEFFFSPNQFLSQTNVLSAPQLLKCGLCMIPREVDFGNACNNILLCGGISSTNGFAYRLQQEIGQNELSFHGQSNGHLLPWKGGTILSQLSSVGNISVSRAEYMEYGPSIVYKKCL